MVDTESAFPSVSTDSEQARTPNSKRLTLPPQLEELWAQAHLLQLHGFTLRLLDLVLQHLLLFLPNHSSALRAGVQSPPAALG